MQSPRISAGDCEETCWSNIQWGHFGWVKCINGWYLFETNEGFQHHVLTAKNRYTQNLTCGISWSFWIEASRTINNSRSSSASFCKNHPCLSKTWYQCPGFSERVSFVVRDWFDHFFLDHIHWDMGPWITCSPNCYQGQWRSGWFICLGKLVWAHSIRDFVE